MRAFWDFRDNSGMEPYCTQGYFSRWIFLTQIFVFFNTDFVYFLTQSFWEIFNNTILTQFFFGKFDFLDFFRAKQLFIIKSE